MSNGYQTADGYWVDSKDVTLAASAARTTDSQGSAVALAARRTLSALLTVSAVAGDSPTLDVILETSYDGSTDWRTLLTFAQKTGAGSERKSVGGADRFVRAKWDVGGTAAAAATDTTGVEGNNNALTWTAVTAGAAGNDIDVVLNDPSGNDQALAVVVVGSVITVNLATGVAGAITSTAAQVKTAIEASAPAAALVTVAHTGASTGAAAVVEETANLAGGHTTPGATFSVVAEALSG